MEQTKIGRNYTPGELQIPAQYCISTPRIHSEARCDCVLGAFLPVRGCGLGTRLGACRDSFPGLLHLQFLITYNVFKADSIEGLGKRLGMQLYSLHSTLTSYYDYARYLGLGMRYEAGICTL